MAQTAKSIILSKFEAGDRPTDQDFLNLFDSILFLNNVGSHNNGLSTANTSLEGDLTIGNNLSVLGTGILSLAGSVSIGNINESVSSKLHVYSDHASNPVMFVSGSSTNIMFSGISGDPTSSISLQDNYASSAVARFGTHTGKAFISLLDNEVVSISASNAGYVSSFSGSIGIGTESPAYTLDLGESSSTIRLVSENNGTAIRVGSGGGSNDVTLLRVDGDSSNHDGESDSAEFGFSLKYMGSRSANENSFSIFSDNQTSTAVEALTILQDGKVGIGKSSVATKLEVNGSIRLTSTGDELQFANNNVAIQRDSGNLLVLGGYGGIDFHAEGVAGGITTQTHRMRITDGGDVGIGTQSPSQKLHLLNSTDDTNLLVESSKTDGRAQIRFKNDVQEFVAGTSAGDNFIVFDATNTTTPFLIEPATPDNTLYVDSNGRIGIGTTSPANTLDVRGDVVISDGSDPAITLFNNDSVASGPDILFHESALIVAESHMHLNINSDGGSDGFSIRTGGDNSSADEIFSITSTGQVSASNGFVGDGSGLTNVAATAITALIANDADNRILTAEGDSTLNAEANFEFTGNDLRLSGSFAIGQGTAGLFTPDAPLHIKHTGDSLGSQDLIHLSMHSLTSEGNISIKFSDGGDTTNQNFKITFGEGNNDLNFHSDSVNHILYLEDGGNVGIGTNSPDSKLEVLGDIAVRNAADNENVILFQNDDSVASKADILFNLHGSLGAESGLHMFLNTDGGTDKFSIYTGGEGTNNASEIFVVQSGSFGTGLRLKSNNNLPQQIAFGGATFTNPTNDDAARIKFSTKNTGGSDYEGSTIDFLVFEKTDSNTDNPDGGILFTNTGQDNTEEIAMAIRGDGKIGLQEIAPSARLHIKSDSNEQSIFVESDTKADAFRLHRTNGANININFTNTDDTTGYFMGMSSAEKFAIGKNANLVTDPLLTVDSSHITMFGSNSGLSTDGGMVFSVEHSATGPTNVPTSEFSSDSDVTTHKIEFSQADGSSDPGLIAHQSRGTTDTNIGILHLCPSDDSVFGDYVFIHGYNEALGLKIHTNARLEFTATPTLSGTGTASTMILGTNGNEALVVQTEHGSTSIGMENTSYTHYKTEATEGHYFQQGIIVDNNSTGGTLSGKAGIESYDTDLFLFDHAGKSYIQIKDTEIDMYADSVQVLDIGKGSTGISISGDGTHTRVNPLGITDSNVTTRLQVKASHLASGGSEVNIIDVVGTNQGDALIHFGQSHNAGGFIYYRGDGTSDSAFDNLPGSDTIFFGSNNHSTVGNQPVMSYKYNGQDVNFHGDVGIGLSADGTHTNPQAKLEVINSGGDTIARFKGTDDNAYVRILQTVDVTGAAGIISENTEGNKIFMGYHDSQLKLVYATGPGSTNGIIINSDGRVGIDTSAGTLHDAFGGVTMELDVHHGDIGCKQLFFEPDENSVGQSFRILIGTFGASTAVRLGFQGSSNGTAAGSAKYITHNASGAAFTGQHPCKPFRSITNYVDKIGHIVVSKGTIANYPENWWNDESNSYDSSYLDKVTINESLPVIELSNQPNDKKVYGVIANVDDPNTTDRDDTNQTGGFSNYIENRIDDRIAVNSVGEGAIMVCNINGNLENGDYITTSAIEGLGMKQDDDLLHNYTVAKIVQDCNFDSGTTDVTYNGVTYKAKLVGCTYHCG